MKERIEAWKKEMETVKNKLQHYAAIFEVAEPEDLAVAETKSALENLHHYELQLHLDQSLSCLNLEKFSHMVEGLFDAR